MITRGDYKDYNNIINKKIINKRCAIEQRAFLYYIGSY